jgi:hypothetical protein
MPVSTVVADDFERQTLLGKHYVAMDLSGRFRRAFNGRAEESDNEVGATIDPYSTRVLIRAAARVTLDLN